MADDASNTAQGTPTGGDQQSTKPRSFAAVWLTIKNIGADVSKLATLYIQLAKTELRSSAKALGIGIAMSIIAIGLILLAAIFLLIGLAYALAAAGLPTWAGFLIVGGVVLLAVGTLALLAKVQFSRVTLPDRTIAAINDLIPKSDSDA
ncbi:MAG: phage holin family protein [Actinobacteria bacterium]|jgi:hypothetical protein|nr:phage holin family protein [Actinomycetota bacterium]